MTGESSCQASQWASDSGRLVAATLADYARAVDARDWSLLASCFTEDTVVSYQGFSDYSGRDAVVAGCRRSLERFEETRHLLGECTVTPGGSSRSVKSTCDVIATHLRANDNGSTSRFTLGGVYTDILVRQGDHYLIAHRVLEVSWDSGDPATMRWA